MSDEEQPRIDFTEMFLGTMTERIFNEMVWWQTRRLGECVATDKNGDEVYEVYIKWYEWNDSRPGNLWSDPDGDY